MSNLEEPNPDFVGVARPSHDNRIEKHDLAEIERAHSTDPGFEKGVHQRYEKVDKELAKYINDEAIHISDEESSRLRRMIDKRVLVIMIATYFIQAIDKGTLSFASIMGIREDTGLHGQQVGGPAPMMNSTNLCSTNGSQRVSTSPSSSSSTPRTLSLRACPSPST